VPRNSVNTASEHEEQASLVVWARLQLKRYPGLEMLVAVPNGGYRTKATAGMLKAEGVQAGYPDLLLDVARGPYHGLRIEMKTAIGVVSKEQKDWIERLTRHGYRAVVCRGWVDAKNEIVSYLGLT
jgi:hypothetical protein